MPHIKTPPIGRDEIVNKIVISKNYLATKKRYFTVFDNMKSEIALAPRKIEEQKLVYCLLLAVTHLITISKVISIAPEKVLKYYVFVDSSCHEALYNT